MTTKSMKVLLPALLTLSMIPISSFAWHGDGPHMARGDYDCRPYHEDWVKAPPRGPKQQLRAPVEHHRHCVQGAHTFGLDGEQARSFMKDLHAILNVQTKQDKVWEKMVSAYEGLATVRHQHRMEKKDLDQLSRQAFLEHHNQVLIENAKAFDAFVKARAELEKVLTPEQMERFDQIITSGRIVKPGRFPIQ